MFQGARIGNKNKTCTTMKYGEKTSHYAIRYQVSRLVRSCVIRNSDFRNDKLIKHFLLRNINCKNPTQHH